VVHPNSSSISCISIVNVSPFITLSVTSISPLVSTHGAFEFPNISILAANIFLLSAAGFNLIVYDSKRGGLLIVYFGSTKNIGGLGSSGG